MRSAEEIQALYEERRKKRDARLARALEIGQTYDGAIVLPLPERDRAEQPAVANLLRQGIEQDAMRIASVLPNLSYPSVRPGIKVRDDYARCRKTVNLGWWEHNRMRLLLQKRARHFIAYASTPVVIRPWFGMNMPRWEVRDPLTAFPCDQAPNDIVPQNTIYAYVKPGAWIARTYPAAWNVLNKPKNSPLESFFQLIEYMDGEEYVLVAVGHRPDDWMYRPEQANANGRPVVLERLANRIGQPFTVHPNRISLNDPLSPYDGMVGMFQQKAKLMATLLIGMEKSVWPETWAVFREDGAGQIVTMADSSRGIMGEIAGGDIREIRVDPNIFTGTVMDRLEREQRVHGPIPAEYGGESSSNVRTGRRGDAILAAAVDPKIQAAHFTFEESLQAENKIAIAIDKAYFPATKSIYVSFAKGEVEYTPGETWETDNHLVRYSLAGADVQDLTISGGQLVGLGALSKRSLMEMHPLVDDAEAESDRIVAEGLEVALLSGIQGRAAEDPMFAPAVARIMQKVRQDKMDLASAYIAENERMQKEQAEAQQGQMVPEEQAVAAQPGLAEPGIPPVQEAPQGLDNMAGLLQALRTGG